MRRPSRMIRIVQWSALAVLIGGPGATQEATTRPRLEEDRRLDARVTLRSPRTHLGLVLRELSRASRVSLRVDTARNPLDGIPLLVVVRSLPAHQVMRAVESLMSTPANSWVWQRDRAGYVLRPQGSLLEAAQREQARVLEGWKQDVRFVHRAAAAGDRDRELLIGSRPDLFPAGHALGERLPLFGRVTRAQLETLLNGTPVPLDESALTDAERRALQLGMSGGPGARASGAPPGFQVSWPGDSTGPVLWLHNREGAKNLVGGTFWNHEWVGRAWDGWTHGRSPEAVDYAVLRIRDSRAAGSALPTENVYDWAFRVADAHGIQVLLDPVAPQTAVQGGWLGKTVRQSMLGFAAMDFPFRKSGEVWLLRHITAGINSRPHLVPLSLIEDLRRDAGRRNGSLGMESTARLALLSPPQLLALSEEFPAAEPESLAAWSYLFRFRAALDGDSRRLLETEAGLPFRRAGLRARQQLEGPLPERVPDPRGLQLLAEFPQESVVSLTEVDVPAGFRRPQPRTGIRWRIHIPGRTDWVRTWAPDPRRPLRPEIPAAGKPEGGDGEAAPR